LSLVDSILSIDPSQLAKEVINLEGVPVLNEGLAAIRIYNLSFIWQQIDRIGAVGVCNSEFWGGLNLECMISIISHVIIIRVVRGVEEVLRVKHIPGIGTIGKSYLKGIKFILNCVVGSAISKYSRVKGPILSASNIV
jgi:hypothetical protein